MDPGRVWRRRQCLDERRDVLAHRRSALDEPAVLAKQVIEMQRIGLSVGATFVGHHGQYRPPDDTGLELGAGIQANHGSRVVDAFVERLRRRVGRPQHERAVVIEGALDPAHGLRHRRPRHLRHVAGIDEDQIRMRPDDDVARAKWFRGAANRPELCPDERQLL